MKIKMFRFALVLCGTVSHIYASAITFTAVGANPAAITAARDSFRVAVGGGAVAGANGSFGGLRREINWDGVPDGLSAPNSLPADLKKLIDDESGLASAKLFARILADDEVRFRDNLVKRGLKFTKLSDDGALKQASEKILEQAIKKASANGTDARAALDKMKAVIAKYQNEH